MDITILQRDFEVVDEPGLDTLDPRMGEIADLVQEGEFAAASEQVGVLLDENVCDVRLLGYAAFGPFLELGVAALGPVFEGLTHVLEESWEAFGPVLQREKGAQTAINWFVKQVAKRLAREEGSQGAAWADWIASVTPDDVDATIKKVLRLQAAADSRLGDGAAQVLDGLSKLRTWLEGFRNAVPYPEEPADETEEEAAADDQPARASGPGAATGPSMAIQGSPYLHDLLRKMDVFAQLAARGEFARALIVADDVNGILEQFDPMIYFPSFFKVFAKVQAVNATQLIEYADHRDSPEWRALQVLYRVDLDEFLDL